MDFVCRELLEAKFLWIFSSFQIERWKKQNKTKQKTENIGTFFCLLSLVASTTSNTFFMKKWNIRTQSVFPHLYWVPYDGVLFRVQASGAAHLSSLSRNVDILALLLVTVEVSLDLGGIWPYSGPRL